MKKRIISTAMALASLCLVLGMSGCSKTSAEKKDTHYVLSVMLWENGSLWNANSEGKMVYVKGIPQGSVVNAVYDEKSENFVETKNFVRISGRDESERTFIHVKFEDEFYWVQDSFIQLNAEPALVLKSAVTYKTPLSTDINTKLKTAEFQIAAVSKEKYSDNFGTEFYKISWNDGKNSYKDVYVKTEDVSVSKDDIYAVQIFRALDKVTDSVIREELLQNLNLISVSADSVNAKKQSYFAF